MANGDFWYSLVMDSGDFCIVLYSFVQFLYRFRTGATFSRFEKAREREETTQKIYIKKPAPNFALLERVIVFLFVFFIAYELSWAELSRVELLC